MDEMLDRTLFVTPKSLLRRKLQEAQAAQSRVERKSPHLALHIRGMVEHVSLAEGSSLSLGRADVPNNYYPDVDLTLYGAKERGISREHARLHVSEGQLYLIDMGSANGTFVDNKRLETHHAHQLSDGDEFYVGQLMIKVVFRDDTR